MNPETLRNEAEKLSEYAARFTGDGQEPDMFGILSEKLASAADAWEARERILAQQVERNSRLVKAEKAIYDELGVVRKRLEEAEATTERVRETGQALLDDANKRLEEAKEELAWRRGPRLQAALAGEDR